MAWWTGIVNFLAGILSQAGYFLSVQFLNLGVFWQLLPIYTGWFAIQFITKGQEGEEIADRFMNGFAILWVGFELGSYLIENFVFNIPMVIKLIIVIGLFVYAVFIMRLTLLNRDISKYLARIGEVSAINIAAMLFIQDLIVITNGLQLLQLVIAFISFYALLDLLIKRLVLIIHKRAKILVEKPEEVPEEVPRPPRYEEIIKPRPPVRPVTRPPARPARPPVRPVTRPPARPAAPTPRPPGPRPTVPTTRPTARPPAKKPGEEELI